MNKYRYYISEKNDPYMNLAIEQDLFRYAEIDSTIIFLWQNADTIVLGKNQNLFTECKAQEFIDDGGRIARRMSGGGAVYHDLGNLNYSIINLVDSERIEYYEILKSVMNAMGVECNYNGRNDLLINGKKFSGNACYDNGTIICQHGTVLVDVDIDRMTYYLTPEASKLEHNHVKSVASRVVNLVEIIDNITVKKMRNLFIKTFEAEAINYVSNEKNVADLYQKFSSQRWINGEK